jgi:hypothetical protein
LQFATIVKRPFLAGIGPGSRGRPLGVDIDKGNPKREIGNKFKIPNPDDPKMTTREVLMPFGKTLSLPSRRIDTLADQASPDQIARNARELGCRSVAFTYKEPLILLEYAVDVAEACHKQGIHTMAVRMDRRLNAGDEER